MKGPKFDLPSVYSWMSFSIC